MLLKDLDRQALCRLAAYVDDLHLDIVTVANIFTLPLSDAEEGLRLGRLNRTSTSPSKKPRTTHRRSLPYAVYDTQAKNAHVVFGNDKIFSRYVVYHQAGPLSDNDEANAWGAVMMASCNLRSHAEAIATALNIHREMVNSTRLDVKAEPEKMHKLIRDLNSPDLTSCRSEMLAVGKPEKE